MSTVIITKGPTGGVKNRLDIRDFVKNEKFFTLYVRALQAFQDKDQTNNESFFQIGGIHGLPYTIWPRPGPNEVPRPGGGYCYHGMTTFPTWHRPYVSLYEQMLQGVAHEIAGRFTDNPAAWIQAADDLRQPFWDWALPVSPPSEVFTDETVSITDYNGQKISVKNPILRYKFRPIHPSFPGNYANWETTIRSPDVNKKEDIPDLLWRIGRRAEEFREHTFNMLTKTQTWNQFSNHTTGTDPHAPSLESVHDSLHVLIGGNLLDPVSQTYIRGHMSFVPVAAFDPIFWLHHTNVDRYLSLWRAMNYEVWVEAANERKALEPFFDTPTTLWNSVPLTDTEKTLSYSYPDFDPVRGGTPEIIRAYIHSRVSKLYGFQMPSRIAANPALQQLVSFENASPEHKDSIDIYDWVIHVTFKYHELHETFSIVFYFAKDGGTPNSEDSYIGAVDAFRGTTSETCENCASQSDVYAESFVHLDPIIARELGTFEADKVHDFLKERQLTYVVQTGEGPLTSLKVKVEGTPFTLPPLEAHPRVDESKPTYAYEDICVAA